MTHSCCALLALLSGLCVSAPYQHAHGGHHRSSMTPQREQTRITLMGAHAPEHRFQRIQEETVRLQASIQDKRRLLSAGKARLANLQHNKTQRTAHTGNSSPPPTPHTAHGTTATCEAGLTRSQFFRDPPSMEAEHAQHADHAHTYPHVTANSLPSAAPTRPSTHLVPRHAAPTLHNGASTLPPPSPPSARSPGSRMRT